MSTFTQFPVDAALHARTSDITALITAYNNVIASLTEHLNATTDTDVHKVKTYVQSVAGDLDSLNTELRDNATLVAVCNTLYTDIKNLISSLDEVSDTKIGDLDNLTTSVKSSVVNAINAVKSSINSLADTVNTKVSSSVTDTITSNLAATNEDVADIETNVGSLDNLTTDDKSSIVAAINELKTVITNLASFWNVANYIDFTKWATFAAQYGGTGATNGTNGLYILGKLSHDINMDNDYDADKSKSATVYIKRVNSDSFDAIVNITVTRTRSGTETSDYNGSIVAQVSKDESIEDLTFELIHDTDSNGNVEFFLAVSMANMSGSSDSNTVFRVAGINFIPAGSTGYTSPNFTTIGAVTYAKCPNTASCVAISSNTALSDIVTANLTTDKIISSNGVTYIEYDVDDTSHKFKLMETPYMRIPATEEGEEDTFAKVATVNDIVQATDVVPVGAILRWASYEMVDDTPILTNIPANYLACNGTVKNTADYPELAAILGQTGVTFTLPNENYSIIKAKV